MDKDKREIKDQPKVAVKTKDETKLTCGCGCMSLYGHGHTPPVKKSKKWPGFSRPDLKPGQPTI